MSKSSQESSPITQWRQSIRSILLGVAVDEATSAATPESRRKAESAITSATIELISELIGPDEPAIYEASFGSSGGPSYAGIARNHLRAELRQSLKELRDGSN